ncbi:MAG: His/Gly/Thr/Pro-type tRNA ligase C-terminal domain-containing protein [Candidatus Paceibacterota bacterium]|jgi:histidyl-tRNA synthetase
MTKQKKTRRVAESKFINFTPIDKAVEAAIYYGFTPTKHPKANKEDLVRISALKESWAKSCAEMPWVFSTEFAEERAAFLREYFEQSMNILPQPVMLVYESETGKERGKNSFNLEVVGTPKSIAEALLIKTAVAILEDNGYKNLSIEINSIGDKESLNKFARELTNYYKKNINELSPHCRQNFKKDAFYVLNCDKCECTKLKEGAPTSVGCLSDESRVQFKEVFEYIETMGIPFKINNCLVPDRKYCSQTIFEIKDNESEDALAIGFRYDGLAQKIGHKKDLPGVGLKVFLKKKSTIKKVSKLNKPTAFYVQLGDDAKHKSLEVIEALRKEKIFIYHMLGRDKFGSQFALVEKSKVPYVIIMGKKESLENSVMIRENATRTQETIKISDLAKYLKKLKA